MNDRNIDIELIMALAEGSLGADEAVAAEASLDGAGRAELAAQRGALAALTNMGGAAMSTAERSNLHSALRDELKLVEPRPAAQPIRQPWYVRALPALGALAALVVVVGIGVNSFGSSDDESPENLTTALDAATTTAATTATTTAASELSGAADDTERFATTTANTQTMAEEAAPTADFGGVYRIMMVPHDLGELSLTDEANIYSSIEEAAVEIAEYTPYPVFSLDRTAAEPGLVCWTFVAGDVSPETQIDYLGVAIVDGESSEIYRTLEPDGEGVIYIIVVEECEPIAVIPR